jgi:hypothetical protein
MMDIHLCKIYHFDQTNIYYSMESRLILAVSIKGSNRNKQYLVMLGASLTGDRLLPYIVFEEKSRRMDISRADVKERVPKNYSLQYKNGHGLM